MKIIFFCLSLMLSLIIFSQNTFTDTRDGKEYKTVTIGNQIWMTENLAFKADSGCLTYYKNTDSIGKYGYYYSWKTALNVCPQGWHLPSAVNYQTLIDTLTNNGNDAYRALLPNGKSGFNAYLLGNYLDSLTLDNKDYFAGYWTASTIYLPDYINDEKLKNIESVKNDTTMAWVLNMVRIFKYAQLEFCGKESYNFVRCVRTDIHTNE
ncbi:MAG: hypothetical protein JEZ09_07900 [Salinivirgaceae bacterium]|nr:hypothetical protein [Salinivirgaceae bacterium]